MSFIRKLSIRLLFVICIIPYAYSIKCWSCRSSADPKCADPFDNTTIPITDCKHDVGLPQYPGLKPSMCRKIRQKVNGEWDYIRDCAHLEEVDILGDERFCLKKTGTDNTVIEYCTCNSKDGCNSSYMFVPKTVLLVTLLVVPWIVFKLIA